MAESGSTDADYHWMSWRVYEEWQDFGDPVFKDNALQQNLEFIGDSNESDELRREWVFNVFHEYVRPGWRSEDIAQLFKGTNWLGEAQIVEVGGIGGYIPVEYYNDEIELILSVIPFAKNRGADPGAFYFCIHGIDTGSDGAKEMYMDFLNDELENDEVYIVEFAIGYPSAQRPYGESTSSRSYSERFTRRGHGVSSNP